MVKQKVLEKTIPPNTDIIKILLSQMGEEKMDYSEYSDEQLLKEKERLLKQLKEENDDNRKGKSKNKV